MTEKIAWFEEVLRLEPNSKLFFPLAQAYMQEFRPQDAVAILRKGLAFHPEHLEARLLLIECLDRHDLPPGSQPEGEQQAPPELTTLITSLTSHPHFWRQWATRCRIEGRADLAVTLEMLAIQLSEGPITWGALLEQGLRTMTGQHAMAEGTGLADTSPSAEPQSSLMPLSPATGQPSPESGPRTTAGSIPQAGTETGMGPGTETGTETAVAAEPHPDTSPEDASGKLWEAQAGESATGTPLERAEGISEETSEEVPEAIPEELSDGMPGEETGQLPGHASDEVSGPLAGSHSEPDQETQPGHQQHDVPSPGADLSPEMQQVTEAVDDAQDIEDAISEGERRYYETKTYADLLARQGELDEAQDLYVKLLQTSLDDQQCEDLRTRIQEIQDRLAKGPRESDPSAKEPADADIGLAAPDSSADPALPASDAAEPAPASSAPKTASKTTATKKTLKKLAERLESRARG